MTHTGTNTWLVGRGTVAVIDPGPHDRDHLRAILRALGPDERVGRILVTHAHRDHASLAPALARATGAPVCAAGDMAGRRRPVMARLAATGLAGGGEGVDTAFAPDVVVEAGDVVDGPGWRLEALATPGHTADHLAFAWGDAVFTGDVVMGWATSMVSPPDGDLTAFLGTCRALRARTGDRVFYPGHGAPVADPASRLDALIDHRLARDAQIRRALAEHPGATAADLTRSAYTDLDPDLLPAARRTVFAHLVAGWEEGTIAATPTLGEDARFSLLTQ